MKKMQLIMLLLIFSSNYFAQISIEYLNDVPAKFKQKYYSKKRDYNPLQIGNMWQYYDTENKNYRTTRIVQDSIINGKKYYKKLFFQTDPPSKNFISWERNDTVSGVSFMLDFQDVNKNGNYLDELPLDSLENPYRSRYKTYKYSYNDPFYWSGEKTTLVKDTSWIKIEGDTVISRYFEISEQYWGERIVENFGVLYNMSESPIRNCTGAIINGRKYGTIVSVDDIDSKLPNEFILENNYPNPFNPSTTISYSIPFVAKQGNSYFIVKLIVYDSLGREIYSLVNEEKTSGRYSVRFNGQGLASGVYYYSLYVDSKRITKSMVLIK